MNLKVHLPEYYEYVDIDSVEGDETEMVFYDSKNDREYTICSGVLTIWDTRDDIHRVIDEVGITYWELK